MTSWSSSPPFDMGSFSKPLFRCWRMLRGKAALLPWHPDQRPLGGSNAFGLCREENHDRLGHVRGRLAPITEENHSGPYEELERRLRKRPRTVLRHLTAAKSAHGALAGDIHGAIAGVPDRRSRRRFLDVATGAPSDAYHGLRLGQASRKRLLRRSECAGQSRGVGPWPQDAPARH
jgi:hypothetical protein